MAKNPELSIESLEILDELRRLRHLDAPTHGGKILAYVYDSGRAELDRLAGEAAEIARPLNGLDPTTFPSIAAMERDLVSFMRATLHGNQGNPSQQAYGSVTSGGTESCLLAVKTARDVWRTKNRRRRHRPRIVAPATVHAAFHKAARAFDLDLDLVPCRTDGSVRASDMIARLGSDVALVVLSAPAYPSGALDPVAEVAAAARARKLSCHVDACFGGLILPWWPDLPAWDFQVPGVTSISADLHKYGYAPKGVSVLLHRGRKRHRTQFFAVTAWSGYPVVNPTLLGSKSASPLAAGWAVMQRLGPDGYQDLTGSCVRAARALIDCVSTVRGLTVQGNPSGPAIALVADTSVSPAEQVDPHHLADKVAELGFRIQHQPGHTQTNGVRLPHSAHLTVTPVTEETLPELCAALVAAADEVRGQPQATVGVEVALLRVLGYGKRRVPGPAMAWRILRLAGAGGTSLPGKLAPLMALAERLPAPVAEALLTELLARVSEPVS